MRKRDRTPKTYTRLTHPLVRDSRDEPFRQASWQEALDRAARGLQRNRGAFGMFSCARATNEMNYVAQKFARVVMGTNNVDSCNRTCHAPSVAGLSAAFGSGGGTYREPASYTVQFNNGTTWVDIPNQTHSPAVPQANFNRVDFAPVTARLFRVLMTKASGFSVGLKEVQAQ